MDIKQYILTDHHMAIKVLESVGYIFKFDDGKNIKFGFDEYSNGSCFYNKETGYFKRWSNNTGGSIIDAVMLKLKCDFKEAVKLIKEVLNIDGATLSKQFVKAPSYIQRPQKTYVASDIDISNYDCVYSDMFLEDGIGIFTHDFFDIRINQEGDRICIPWRDDSKVVGVLGRINKRNLDEFYRYKYITLEKFRKSNHVYGLYENYEFINLHKKAHIFEAEKSVLQCFEMGFRTAVAVGSSSFSIEQMDLIYNAGARDFTLMFDEGSNNENIYNIALTIKNRFKDAIVKVVFDKDNKILKKNSKNSPSDVSYKMYELLTEKYCFEI